MEVASNQEEREHNKEHSLKDILIDPSDNKHLFDDNFVDSAHDNARKQLGKFHIANASEIIPSWLYLGNKVNSSDKASLQSLGITHILNVSDLPCFFPNTFTYAQIQVDDLLGQKIQPYFAAATAFIDTVNPKFNESNSDQHLKLFVHCAVGKSRSATIVIQYLMRRGIDFSNKAWVSKIEEFGLVDNLRSDDRILNRSQKCCPFCCVCWFKCWFCCDCCCNGQVYQADESIAWRSVCDIGSMSFRNSCDYVLKCRYIICPNQSFASQLTDLERSVRNGMSTNRLCATWELNAEAVEAQRKAKS